MRLGLTSVMAVAVLGAVGTVGGYLVPRMASENAVKRPASAQPVPTTSTAPPGGVPGGVAMPTGSPSPTPTGSPADAATGPAALSKWAEAMSQRVGVSTVAMQAYGYAELVTTKNEPGCHLHWPTLAGIGKIESNHGTHGSSTLSTSGLASPPIYGPALDGTDDNKLIRDTDHGSVDGDPVYDRAVGPMQFLPGTWSRWGTDGDGDAAANPQDINDAALSAARYLCADGNDLGTGEGWWGAIHSYNNLDKYATDVYAAADAYGIASGG